MARRPKMEGPPPKCQVCRAEGKPAFVAWELGFVAGAKWGIGSKEMYGFVNDLCDPHATSFSRILANRVKTPT